MTGSVDMHYLTKSTLRTKRQSLNADPKNLYLSGAEANIANFHESIAKGDYTNPTVAPSVRSNLATILGRTAAHENTTVTWDEMMRNPERLVADLKGLKT
jgi:myo-inositol 2-dehydrogenase/D-chiro-inositol 1-dehydrogenase